MLYMFLLCFRKNKDVIKVIYQRLEHGWALVRPKGMT